MFDGEEDVHFNEEIGGVSVGNEASHNQHHQIVTSMVEEIQDDILPRFSCEVTDPEKRGDGMYQHVVYTVNTNFIDVDGLIRDSSVERRFSDFVSLHDRLYNSFPGVLIPPLPNKAIMGRFSGKFIKERRRGLESFMNRLNHKKLINSPELHVFLHGDMTELEVTIRGQDRRSSNAHDEDFANMEGYPGNGGNGSSSSSNGGSSSSGGGESAMGVYGGGLFSYIKGSIDSLSSSSFSSSISSGVSALTNSITAMGNRTREKTPDDIACDAVLGYASSIKTKLTVVSTNTEALLQHHKNITKTWYELGHSLQLLGQQESNQDEEELGRLLTELGSTVNRQSEILTSVIDDRLEPHLEAVRDQERIVDSVKKMMAKRNEAVDDYHKNRSKLESVQERLKVAQTSSDGINEDTYSQLHQQMVEQEQRVRDSKRHVDGVTSSCLAETEAFKKEKNENLKKLCEAFVVMQIEHTAEVQREWEGLLRTMNSPNFPHDAK